MPWRELNDDRAQWEVLRQVPAVTSGLFLQTPAWRIFAERLGHQVLTFGWYSGSELKGVAQCVRQPLPFGIYYWLVPKGPRFVASLSSPEQTQALNDFTHYLKPQGSLFIRFEPTTVPHKAIKTVDFNPRATSLVNLAQPWQNILAHTHPKTRYNLSLAERKGLNFHWGSMDDFQIFWQLLRVTAQREGFRTHASRHYRTLLELFADAPLDSADFSCRLALVSYQGEILAASLLVVSLGVATYLHGASGRNRRELMAPYLLHGEAMRQLKAAGCHAYDLWGIEPADSRLPSWSGFSRFKLGWGGRRFEYPGTFDLPYTRWGYTAYRLLRRVRRML